MGESTWRAPAARLQVALKGLAASARAIRTPRARLVREARQRVPRSTSALRARDRSIGASGTALYIAMSTWTVAPSATSARRRAGSCPGARPHVGARSHAALTHAHGLGWAPRFLSGEHHAAPARPGPGLRQGARLGWLELFDERAIIAGTAISMSPLTQGRPGLRHAEYSRRSRPAAARSGRQSDCLCARRGCCTRW